MKSLNTEATKATKATKAKKAKVTDYLFTYTVVNDHATSQLIKINASTYSFHVASYQKKIEVYLVYLKCPKAKTKICIIFSCPYTDVENFVNTDYETSLTFPL